MKENGCQKMTARENNNSRNHDRKNNETTNMVRVIVFEESVIGVQKKNTTRSIEKALPFKKKIKSI